MAEVDTAGRALVLRQAAALRSLADQLGPSLDADADEARGPAGALDGLIRPGTREAADLSRLERVRRLARHLPVGMDGGVRPEHTPSCLAAGAVHLVSGRALLQPAAPAGVPVPVPLEGAR